MSSIQTVFLVVGHAIYCPSWDRMDVDYRPVRAICTTFERAKQVASQLGHWDQGGWVFTSDVLARRLDQKHESDLLDIESGKPVWQSE